MYKRAVLHLDMDTFFVSVERKKNRAFIGKPLIIGGYSQRAVVASCSYEARRFGVHSAMPMQMALRLCPDAIVLKGDIDSYSKESKVITAIIAEEAPVFEKASIDEFYVDLTGMDKYVGCWKWSQELFHKIQKETGLPTSCGLSINKLIAKVSASEAKPNGARQITAGAEQAFLDPLSTLKIPYLGHKTYKKLSFMGVRTIRKLRQIPPPLLQREFGRNGLSLWKKSNGIDHSPVRPYSEKKSISSERTFQTDTIDIRYLTAQLIQLVMKLTFEMRQTQKLCSCITIKIRYTDFNTYTQQKRIPYTAHDNILIDHAKQLFTQLYSRRQLVRLIGVKFSGLVHGNQQIDLFQTTIEENQLLQQMDRIRKRFGKHAVVRASSLRTNKK